MKSEGLVAAECQAVDALNKRFPKDRLQMYVVVDVEEA